MAHTCPPTSNLSLRQRQILELIRQGKSNHEIAFELGIGVGTVKQHVVALFRKLKVTSRAMAVSREPQGTLFGCDTSLGSSTNVILERRPCITLSMALEEPDPDALRRLHANMARVAQDAGDIVLSWRGKGCDIILGIEQIEESAPVRALRCAQTIAQTHAGQGRPGGRLKGALAAGLAVASMFRCGGWSGEAIASSSIVLARHRTTESEPGRLFLDQTFTDLLGVCDATIPLPPPYLLSLEDAPPLDWHPLPQTDPIVSRKDECRTVLISLRNASRDKPVVCLWGEAGVGKSWLCAKLTALLEEQGQAVTRIQCLPPHAPAPFFRINDRSLLDGVALGPDDPWRVPAAKQTTRKPKRQSSPGGPVLILDNTQWVGRQTLQNLVSQALGHGYRVLTTTRGPEEPDSSTLHHVPPIKDSAIATHIGGCIKPLIRKPALAHKVAHNLAALAGGNPFFTQELVRGLPMQPNLPDDGHSGQLPLAIVLRVTARFDALRLDRRLLRFVSQSSREMTLKDLSLVMGEEEEGIRAALDAANSASILGFTTAKRIVFSHPMYQRVTQYLGMDI